MTQKGGGSHDLRQLPLGSHIRYFRGKDLKTTVNNFIWTYESGFKSDESTIDQILTIRQILRNIREKRIDSTVRSRIYDGMYIGIWYFWKIYTTQPNWRLTAIKVEA